mgnify:CR=1 FL=1
MMDEQAYNEEILRDIEADAESRRADREKQEAHDKEIQRRIHAGEDGQSVGWDNRVAVLMLGFAGIVTVLILLSLYLGHVRYLSYPAGNRIICQLRSMPEVIDQTLKCHEQVEEISGKYSGFDNFLYLGRLYNFPVALEGALKLKEISYIYAEGYPGAEMKHCTIALVDKKTPSVFFISRGGIYPKVVSNMEEVKARKGPVIAVACEGETDVARIADDVICVPDVEEYLQPLVCAILLQLLSYHVALLRGCNVD